MIVCGSETYRVSLRVSSQSLELGEERSKIERFLEKQNSEFVLAGFWIGMLCLNQRKLISIYSWEILTVGVVITFKFE